MSQPESEHRRRWAVIFDWGGVICRTADYGPRHAWDRQLGLPEGTVESIVHGIPAWREAQCGQMTLDAYWQTVRTELHLTSEQLDGLRRDFYSGDQLDDRLITLIHELRRNRIPVGLMSNNTPDLRDTLSDLGIGNLFNACVISAEIGVMKPDANAYHAILKKMQASAEDAIFIDDFIENVEGARAIGMKAIHFKPAIDLRGILKGQYDIG
jgi:HAD superfamily hydrolase (TIGR01509 family)